MVTEGPTFVSWMVLTSSEFNSLRSATHVSRISSYKGKLDVPETAAKETRTPGRVSARWMVLEV